MAYTFDDVLTAVRDSRSHFLKHIEGITAEQWQWKPHQEAKSIAEIVAHLVTDDRMALQSLQNGQKPVYRRAQVSERDPAKLLAELHQSHEALSNYLLEHFSVTPLDTIVTAWGIKMKLGKAAGHIVAEDYYHAGQAAYIRLATEPDWDYYATIYG
jgi:uncharacterized damage-inducible protein DinB